MNCYAGRAAKDSIQSFKNRHVFRGQGSGDARPVLDRQNKFENGVLATAGKFTIENLVVRNYTENGVIVRGADGATFRPRPRLEFIACRVRLLGFILAAWRPPSGYPTSDFSVRYTD